jgi:hypothetical protein
MIMEAMRLSLLDHEEQQRKEAAEKRARATAAAEAQLEDSHENDSSASPEPSAAQAHTRTNSQLAGSLLPSSSVSATSESAQVNSKPFNKQVSQVSSGCAAKHPSGPSSLSSTSTANVILGNEASSDSLPTINGLSNGDQMPSNSKPITPSSENGTFNDESLAMLVANSSSSVSLSVSPTYDHLPSSPDSPSASESLLGSNAQTYRKVTHSVENGQESLR